MVLAALVFRFVRSGSRESLRRPPAAAKTAPETAIPGAADHPPKNVTVFFAREADDQLAGEERRIPADPSPVREAEAILAELIKGPAEGGIAAVPPETKLWQVFLTADGTAYVDFSREVLAQHPAGSSAELATIYAVVNSLAFNLKSVKQVFLLIDGEEKETLAGHIGLERPFRPNFSLIVKN
jgi:spore germination protein GerM